ncbi:CHAT domain-containing protein [Mycena rosella]|uniref:CHAT domain-containing protein n=1 Tax=Mycena rosella TaxID=1033263 RepID=A0AAD7DAS2_MYCRO|nr:CHAT domain-containing protein [Mycena rosella]
MNHLIHRVHISVEKSVDESRSDNETGFVVSSSVSGTMEIQELQNRVEETSLEDPQLPRYIGRLGTALLKQYREGGDLANLEAAVKNLQHTVDLTPEGHSDRARYLHDLGVALTDRYRCLGEPNDVEVAVKNLQEALDLTSKGHQHRAQHLQSLAASLNTRFRCKGDFNDVQAALQANQEAVDITPKGHPDRARHLLSLAASFTERYRRLGDVNDLHSAVQADQEAVNITPRGDPNRAMYLGSLAISFWHQYRRMGKMRDLQLAMQANQDAIEITPKGHPERAGRVLSRAFLYKERYQRLGDPNDLQVAFHADQTVVDLTPNGHPERALRLQSLAVSFKDQYRRLGDINDLQAGLRADQEAVSLTPKGHPQRAYCLQSLAVSFKDLYQRIGDLNNLQAAFQADREAVDIIPKDDPERAGLLHSLAVSLTERYRRLGDINDLEAALQVDEEAVGLTPEGQPERSYRLQNLAVAFFDKYRKLGRPENLQASHEHYAKSFESSTSTPERSWKAALDWASISNEFKSSNCIIAYSKAFHLLAEILWIGNDIDVRHEAIHRFDIGTVSSAAVKACIDFGELSSAVEIMEQGLGITFQQMLQLRTDLDGIHPDQAHRLQVLSSQLYSGTSLDPKAIATERQELLETIRQQPGLEYFLLPKPYKVLRNTAKGGPVILLNSHHHHCDGLIISGPNSDPVHVPLPGVTLDGLKSQQEALKRLLSNCNVRTREASDSSRLFGCRELFGSKTREDCFKELLAWIYEYVVTPVYKVLESLGIHNGRLWWLLTGAFSGLPLHASPPTNQFIHSYTATLGSLLDANIKEPCSPPTLGIVGVTHTGGRSNFLPGIAQEVKNILSVVNKSHVQCLEGQQATVDAVKLRLQDCSWIHLACHGVQDLIEPAKSHLLLYEGSLELKIILQMNLSNAEFVFLAACQTAMGDSKLVNESFHLGGGFIAAGFRGAIATMWSMKDSDGPLVAESVYSHLFREGRQPQATDAAEALQLAVEELKAKKVPFERWIPFIHMGI